MKGAILTTFLLAPLADGPVSPPDQVLPVFNPDHVPEEPTPAVLFVNFDGGVMQTCAGAGDDPHQNCSTVFQGTVYPYSGGETERAAVLQHVAADLAPFAVEITDERPPADVDYDMEMVGDWNQATYGFAGIAPHIDCGNALGGATSFSLEYSDSPLDIAKVILQEVAHTWGLEHVASKGDLLYPKVSGDPDPQFENACSIITRLDGFGIVKPDIGVCPAQHMESCGDPNQQNSFAELTAILGPSFVDTTPPTVSILSPADDDVVEGELLLEASIDDDGGDQTFTVRVDVDDASREDPFDGPGVVAVPVGPLGLGLHTLSVTVTDIAGNVSSDQIQVSVLPGGGVPPDPVEGDEHDGSGSGDPGAGPDGDETGADGCSCSTAGDPRLAGLALGLGLVLVRRRRR